MSDNNYDYIILGAGAAGLSLAYRMTLHPFFDDKRILLIDKSAKKQNDRTWCFWENRDGLFDSVIHKQWPQLTFYSDEEQIDLSVKPYVYKMIRGKDFYDFTLDAIGHSPNVSIITDEVRDIELGDVQKVICRENNYFCRQIFKSFPSSSVDKNAYLYVNQHFKGWFIRTETDVFDENRATFMDFRIEQEGEERFMYVLPTSKRTALIEVAIFSNNILYPEKYNDIIQSYINEYLGIESYILEEEEFGIIPMTSYPFWKDNKEGLFHIGTGGGVVKPSSGYAFQRIQRHSESIIQCLISDIPLAKANKDIKSKYFLYDCTMLNAILKKNVKGSELFTALFSKTEAARVFKFLDGDTTLMEEMSIFKAPPMFPFFRAFLEELRFRK